MNSRNISLFIIISLFISGLQGQEMVEIRKKDFRKGAAEAEGFKEAWKSIREGDKYYEEGAGTYNIARDHYLFAHQFNSAHPGLNYRIGVCYLYGDDPFNAIDYFLAAYDADPDITGDIKYMIGRSYHMVEKFDKAKQYYMEYRQDLAPGENMVSETSRIDKLIMECEFGKDLSANPRRVIIQNLGEAVNSVYDDYNPQFAYNDTALFFTSRRPMGKRPARSSFDNKYFENIYISPVEDGKAFMEAYSPGKPFNAKGNNAIVGVAPDGDQLFMYLGEEDGGSILAANYKREKGKWKKPKRVSKKIESDAEETSVALSPDGEVLYYVSANPELTMGGKDILMVRKTEKGKWGDPEPVSGLINTIYDEEGVFLSSDGQVMYFSSKGHNSMGGFDVFRSVKGEDGRWEAPENIGYPVNTPNDEVFYITDTAGFYGYYSAQRENGLGGKDIYKVISLGAEKQVLTRTRDSLVAGLNLLEKNLFLSYPEQLAVDTTLILSGQVKDTIDGADTTIMAGLSFLNPGNGEVVARAMTGVDGYYRTRIPEPGIYGVEINATGYLYYLDILDLSGLNPDEPAERNFYLQKIEVGTKVVLDNIYFETGKSVLTPNSYESLDQVVRFLENNQSVRLEISGHTDNTGSLRINTRLSEARARAVVNYLVENGIAQSRLEYKGYADTQPVAENDTPEGREMNRRVEFKVLEK